MQRATGKTCYEACVTCKECGKTFEYVSAADWARVRVTGCCSEHCNELRNLSLIYDLDKSALLPLLPQGMLDDVLEAVIAARAGHSPKKMYRW